MRKLTPVFLAATLAALAVLTVGTPYDQIAEISAINSTPAHEILKLAAIQEAMSATEEQPTLEPGLVIVLPGNLTSRVVTSAHPTAVA